ncbi:aldehyde dehydrogenase [Frankia sp. AgB1.9]|uniref:aldehyde dehydrogenase n=1 Tax=unclassified Frankia TaxID=2632575 RepID=UPI00193391C3|nr:MULTISPECIES: aldehyde dehydrogenase [unclassified Frankia]MBL7491158.1 aldehyde dehydrogenase [Frankia sp. AgW1.1]MBL7548756.1 aldehyde dehydrogenase [Frankia sp. AgB1.9]MBL7623912.1 aldehyde dehydrogenase [Frankia sp. AgB1.8]
MSVTNEVFIGGKWVPATSESYLDVRSPSTEEVVGRVPDAGAADVDAAVSAARLAFDEGPWPRLPPAERARVLELFLGELTARADELGRTITLENGTPVSVVRPAQVDNGLDVVRYYAESAAALELESPRAGRYSPLIVRHEPVGTVAAIVPWNVPFFLGMMKVAPALAAGCTIVLKSAPETPLHANVVAEAALAAGLPPGVLNVLAAGPASSELLVTHPGIDKIAFTGSTAVGKRIAGLAGAQLKRVTLELGGKSAAIVLDDIDLPTAMARLTMVSLFLSGQFCVAQSRILVSRERYDEAVELFAASVSALPVGDPADRGTFLGPLISRRQRDRVLGYIEIGRGEGATVVTGGGKPAGLDRGWYVEPTVFRDVDAGMRIAQEEIFGPVVAFIPYDDEDDAVAIANGTDFGLHGTVWTGDVERGLEIGRRIRTGSFGVNGLSLDPAAPFGGMKQSGLGRELGPEGLHAYLDAKTMTVPAGTSLPGSP